MQPTNASPAAEIADWLHQLGKPAVEIEPLAGDVSRRRYFRIRFRPADSAIVSVYPQDMTADCRRFAATTQALRSISVPCPNILAMDCDRGLMLLEDLGPATLYSYRRRSWPELTPYLENGVEIQSRIASLPSASIEALAPPLDAAALGSELRLAWERLLGRPQVSGPESLRRMLNSSLDKLIDALNETPLVPCHRDFMARNLVPLPYAPALSVLDHQDLRLGPRFYDLASLLNDSLFPPWKLEEQLLDTIDVSNADRQLYRRCAVQRMLKAATTFTLFADRGASRHLPLVAPTLKRAAHHLRLLPEGRELPRTLFEHWTAYGAVIDPVEC